MAGSIVAERAPKNTTFRDVFAVGEFRALWFAQLLSIGGDQFARVAISVLVYERTRSALLSAVAYAVSVVPMFIGGVALGWLADRYPRRRVMVGCDLVCLALVLVMAVPGVRLLVLVVLLFLVTLVSAPFFSARMATNREVLGRDRFALGNAVTITTQQAAQVIGFGAGGVVAGLAGPRIALLIDAATFGASALLIRIAVRPRPAPGGHRPGPQAGMWSGVRVVSCDRVARAAVLLAWLVAFIAVPEGVSAPLGRAFGGGAATVGLLLAAMTAGAAVGPVLYARLLSPARQMRVAAVLAVAACAVLVLFALSPSLIPALVILGACGLCSCYVVAASAALASALPDEQRGRAFGVSNGGMCLGQGVMYVVGGAAAGAIGAAHIIAICGAAGAAVAVVLAVTWRRLVSQVISA